jgi:uncharacterized OB-fold protein
MMDAFAGVEPAVYKSAINVPYHWWAGETATRFFAAIRDERKFMGTKCLKCSTVFLPPRKNCIYCFTENEEWVSLGNEGKLVSYTVARRPLAALPKKPPVIYGLIKLDGADTALLHMLDEVSPADLKIGMRMRAKFADERKGTIMDIEYFKPAK